MSRSTIDLEAWEARVLQEAASAKECREKVEAVIATAKSSPPSYQTLMMEELRHLASKYRRERRIFTRAKERCLNPDDSDYPAYGGRGVQFSKEWQKPWGFVFFMRDVGPRPDPSFSLLRKNPFGNYTSCNVYWGPPNDKNVIKRNSLFITIHGRTLSTAQWARLTGMKFTSAVANRIARGWNPIAAVLAPDKTSKATAHIILTLRPLLDEEEAGNRSLPCFYCGKLQPLYMLYENLDREWCCIEAPCPGRVTTDE